MSRLEELAAQLEVVSEGLSEAAIEVLRDALDGTSRLSPEQARRTERLLNRARSAVERASGLLREASGELQGPGNE